MKKMLFIIQLPPPTYGVTTVNKFVYESNLINENAEKHLIKVNYSQSLSELKKITLKKIFLIIKLWFKLLKELISYKPDYVYYTVPPTGIGFYKEIPNILLLKLFNKKPIFHLHGKGIQQAVNTQLKKRIYNYILSKAIIIHLSEGLLRSELQNLILKKSKLFAAPNGVETYNIMPKKVSDSIDFLFLSNIQESKGIFLLLDAFSELARINQKIRLNIIGGFRDQETEIEFNKIIDQNNLREKIQLHGPLYGVDKHKKIAQCDVLVHPSFNDAFPLVILEAMQHGLAIIGSDQGAIPEIINPKVGYVFQTGNRNKLLEHMQNIASNTETRKLMQNNAKELFYKQYTIQHFEERMSEIFRQLS